MNRILSLLVVVLVASVLLLAGCTSTKNESSTNPQTAAPVPTVSSPQEPTPAPQTPSALPVVKPEAPKPVTSVDCNPLKDGSCTTLSVGQEALVGSDLKLEVSNITTQHCDLNYQGGESEDYLVFDVSMENVGNGGTVYVAPNVFSIMDSAKSQRDASIISYPYGGSTLYSTPACQNAKDSALDSGNIVPGSLSTGKVWIQLNKPLPSGDSYIMYNSPLEHGPVFFKFNTN